MLALSKGPNPEERKMLEEKLEQFRDKKPRRDEWAPRAESADPA
jgi:hypothetical protein